MRTLIQVCGASRSGTTMLDLMLGNAPNAFSCGEVYAWFRPWRSHHFSSGCRCGQEPCPVWEQIGGVSESHLHRAIFEKFGVDFVVDSSKDLCWLIDSQKWAVGNDVRVFNLLLWKNPISLAYSHFKRGGGVGGWRRNFLSYYVKFLEAGLPFRAINFNDLVSNPQQKLADICRAVDMPYFEGKAKFWEKEHHYLFGSHGTFRQVADKNSSIRATENYPPEFIRYIDTLTAQIAADDEVQRILKALQQADISPNNRFSPQEQMATAPQPYPMWYYGMKARQIYRRYFPVP